MEDKKTYIDKLTVQLKKLDAELDKLKIKADKAKIDVKAEYQKQIEELRNKKTTIASKMETIKGSSDEAWSELRTGLEKSWTELKSALDNAISKFK